MGRFRFFIRKAGRKESDRIRSVFLTSWLPYKKSGAALRVVLGLGLIALAFLIYQANQRAHLRAPPATLILLDRHDRFLAELGRGSDELGYWPVDPIPPRVASAMIAIEDRNFWAHSGVDVQAVLRAVWQNLSSGDRISGASTIAMQVARMQDPGPRSYRNKVVEAFTAMLLVQRYGRENVLAHYLRIAPYGNRARGIGFAARRYFDKPVADLSWAEIAFLAAIPQSPSRMNPYDWRGRKRTVARGERILDLLAAQSVLTEAEHALAKEQIEVLSVPMRPSRPEVAMHAILRMERELASYRGDPFVRTTLDLELMESLQEILDEQVHRLSRAGADNGAMVVADRETSTVVAYLGSADWFDPSHAGAIDFAATPRSSGSTLKPFVYALALERGVITPATILDDLFRAKGGVSNADDRFLGPLLPRVALANSRNVPAANLAEEIGLHPVYDLLGQLSLHHREKPVEHYGSGVALGLLPVTLFDLVSAYTAFASDGRLRPLSFTASSLAEERRVFSRNTARQITGFLSDPMARLPTFPRMGTNEYPFPVAIKTGTSQAYRDAWTVAYTQRYLIGVWIGRGDAKPMNGLGGMAASSISRHAIGLLHAGDFDGLHDLAFRVPEDLDPVRICALSGKVATERCEHTFVEHLEPSDGAALESCDVHVQSVGSRTFARLPPRYAEWAHDRGIEGPPPLLLADVAESAPRILRPEAGARIIRDPEVPEERATLALAAAVEPDVRELVWYVDGIPFATVGPPFSTRWPLATGAHVFEAKVPYRSGASARVEVIVE